LLSPQPYTTRQTISFSVLQQPCSSSWGTSAMTTAKVGLVPSESWASLSAPARPGRAARSHSLARRTTGHDQPMDGSPWQARSTAYSSRNAPECRV
jgi:hypothetical protein